MSNVRLPLFQTVPAAQPDAIDAAATGATDTVPAGTQADGTAEVDEKRVDAADEGAGGDRQGPLMQIGDLARESGKTVRAIHLYEELGLLQPVARSKGRYRLYANDALLRIRWIGKLQDMGFSLTDIQTVVRDWEELSSAPRAMVHMRDVYKKKLAETRAHLARLEALEKELEASLVYLDTCEVCEPARLLSACKACDLHSCNDHVPDLVAGFRASNANVLPILAGRRGTTSH